jgi:hypothetical protein
MRSENDPFGANGREVGQELAVTLLNLLRREARVVDELGNTCCGSNLVMRPGTKMFAMRVSPEFSTGGAGVDTWATFSISQYARQLTVSLRCDPHLFRLEDTAELLRRYMAQLRLPAGILDTLPAAPP